MPAPADAADGDGVVRDPGGDHHDGTPDGPELAFFPGSPNLATHGKGRPAALLVHSRFFGEIDPGDRARYYDETKTIASLMGIPEATIPPTPRAFDTYMNGMLRSRKPTVTETARDLASAVPRPPVPLVGGAAAPPPAREHRP